MPDPTSPPPEGFVAVTPAPAAGEPGPAAVAASLGGAEDRRRPPLPGVAALVAVASMSLAAMLAVLPDSGWRTAWAVIVALSVIAIGLLGAAATRARDDAAAAHGFTLTCARTGAVALAAMAAAPWLPGHPALAAAPLAMTIGLGTLAIAATATFAAIGARAAAAALLPWSPVAASWAWAPGMAEPLVATGGVAALASIGALAVGWVGWRQWRHEVRVTQLQRAHGHALQVERDIALRSQDRLREHLAETIEELRQPVNALGLFSVALEARLRTQGDEWQARNMLQAIASLERSLAALSASEREPPGSERVALDEVFGRVLGRYAGAAAEAGLRLRAAAGSKEAFADAQLLESLLGHLIEHALAATKSGGVAMVARRHGGHIHVDISDTDAGATPGEVAARFAAPASGADAALAMARQLAEQSDWSLSVASRRGHGTTFRVDVPDAAAATRALDAQDASALRARRAPSPAALRTLGRFLGPRPRSTSATHH